MVLTDLAMRSNTMRLRSPRFAVTCMLVCLNPLVSNAGEPSAPVKVGIIGMDSYHALAFTQLFHDPKAEGGLAGIRVVAAFPGGSPDIAESAESLPKWLEQIKPFGVEMVDSIDALLAKVDAVMITSLDGPVHPHQGRALSPPGQPPLTARPL